LEKREAKLENLKAKLEKSSAKLESRYSERKFSNRKGFWYVRDREMKLIFDFQVVLTKIPQHTEP